MAVILRHTDMPQKVFHCTRVPIPYQVGCFMGHKVNKFLIESWVLINETELNDPYGRPAAPEQCPRTVIPLKADLFGRRNRRGPGNNFVQPTINPLQARQTPILLD